MGCGYSDLIGGDGDRSETSWAVPLSWEITAKALVGRPEALIRWGMFSDASSNPRIADFRDPGLGEAV